MLPALPLLVTPVPELTADAVTRQRIAELLGDRGLAASYAAVGGRLRKAVLRRDVAVILESLE